MKKITIKKIDEDIYYEKLDNGLDVYLYTNKNVSNNYVTFTTKYGSIYREFEDNNGKMVKMSNGIAHFLEHKVFAEKDGPQPEEFYGANGALSNAYTTFENTTYLFSGVGNLEENINYLLDFVGNLYLTKENIEAEKGIIVQEIHMCNDRPADILYDTIRKNTIKNSPFRESIIGTEKEVRSITKEMLETCYYSFYHPSNMFLVVTGNFDKDKILRVIKDNQSKKQFKEVKHGKLKKYNEPNGIVKEYEMVKCNTDIPKMAYSIKIPVNDFKISKRKLSIYMFILFNLLFGDTSDFDERCKRDGIITGTLFYTMLNIDSHFIISLLDNGEHYEELVKRIDKELKNIKFSEKDFERKKKVLISNEIFSYEYVESVNDMIIDNIIFDGKIETDIVDMIRSLNMEELNEIVKKIDFKNKSVVVLKKQ